MLHVVSLPVNEATKVENHTSRLVALASNGGICVLKSGELFLVALPLSLELFGNVLLKDKRLESIVALFLCTIETLCKARSIILVLFDKRCKAAVFAFVSLDFDFELLCFFSKLFGKGLELEKLPMLLEHRRKALRIPNRTCCFQLSSSSTRKLFLLVTLVSSPSIRPLRLMKSCHASMASLEY